MTNQPTPPEEPPESEGFFRDNWPYLALGLIVFVVGFGVYQCCATLEDRALVGGFLSGIAGTGAFVGFLIALHYQRRELRLQREELRLQRQELSFQRKELELTRVEIHTQAEESKQQTALIREQVSLQYEPKVSLEFLVRDRKASLMIVNRGKGIAQIQNIRLAGKNGLAVDDVAVAVRKTIQAHFSNADVSSGNGPDFLPGCLWREGEEKLAMRLTFPVPVAEVPNAVWSSLSQAAMAEFTFSCPTRPDWQASPMIEWQKVPR